MRVHLRRVVSAGALGVCGLWLVLTLAPPPPSSSLPWEEEKEGGFQQQLAKARFPHSNDHDDKYQHFTLKVQPPTHHKNHKKSYVVTNKTAAGKPHRAAAKPRGRNVALPQYLHGSDPHLSLWPDPDAPHNDRILDQMRYVPSGLRNKDPDLESNIKTIYLPAGISSDIPKGRKKFKDEHCPVDMCWLTDSAKWRVKADVVLYQNEYYYGVDAPKPEGQLWVLWLLESPFHTGLLHDLNGKLNWTATYRSDSTIVTPYEKFVHYSNYTGLPKVTRKNYAKGKSKLLAWFVSNCSARNLRWEYVEALRGFGIDVHIYGACGDYECDRYIEGFCDNMLKENYKFYLSFENSNCQGYITEKFFQNALKNDVVPVVMGGRPEDYEHVAPPHSYIHVEQYSSPRFLAELLLRLNMDDEQYNQYFRWKHTGEFINTKFWCRLCALVHDDSGVKHWYPDVEGWWRGNGTCTFDRWDDERNYVQDWPKAMEEW